MPATIPLIDTVATAVLLDDHVPPLTGLLSVVAPPLQRVIVPDIAAGSGFTVNNLDTLHPADVA